MIKVLIVGCSFTCGMPDNDWYNWTYKFTELSQCNVINMALGGANMQFIAYCLEKAKKEYGPDFIIVQKTVPFRLTLVKENFNISNHLIRETENHWRLDPKLREAGSVLTITPSNAKAFFTTNQSKVKFAQWYFKHNKTEFGLIDYDVYNTWLDNNSDFSFSTEYFKDLSSDEKYKLDKVGHLNKLGSDILADRVYNDIKRDLYKNLS
jgi:hypothetical protein